MAEHDVDLAASVHDLLKIDSEPLLTIIQHILRARPELAQNVMTWMATQQTGVATDGTLCKSSLETKHMAWTDNPLLPDELPQKPWLVFKEPGCTVETCVREQIQEDLNKVLEGLRVMHKLEYTPAKFVDGTNRNILQV